MSKNPLSDMSDEGEVRQLMSWHPARERFAIAGSIALDALFFGMWAVINWLFNTLLKFLSSPKSIDSIIFDIFLVIFSVTTSIPLIRYILIDTSIVIVRTVEDLKKIWSRRGGRK